MISFHQISLLNTCIPDPVRFLIGTSQKRAKCSRQKLTANSPYFAALLDSNKFKEGTQHEIQLDVPPFSSVNSVALILEEGFAGDFSEKITRNNVAFLYAAADYYDMSTITVACVDYIRKHGVSTAGCLVLFRMNLQGPKAHLPESVSEMIGNIFPLIQRSQDFGDLQPDELSYILSRPFLVLHNELDVFETLCQWLKINSQINFETLQLFLQEIRWYALTDVQQRECQKVLGDMVPDQCTELHCWFRDLPLCDFGPLPRDRNTHQCLYVRVVLPKSQRTIYHTSTIYELDFRGRTVRAENWPYDISTQFMAPKGTSWECSRISVHKLERRTYAGAMFRLGPALKNHCFAERQETGIPNCEIGNEVESVILDGKHYYLEGFDLYVHEIHDRDDAEQLESPSLTSKRNRDWEFKDVVTAGCDGNLYVYNGLDFARYDIRKDEWENLALPAGPRRGRSDMIELNGCIYLTGGYDKSESYSCTPTEFSKECTRFRLRTRVWESIAPMNAGRGGRHLCIVDGQLVAVGGLHPDQRNRFDSVERYDADNNVWRLEEFVIPGLKVKFRISQYFVADITCFPT